MPLKQRPIPEPPTGEETPVVDKKIQEILEPTVPAVIPPTYVYTGDLTDEELLTDQKKIEKTISETFPPEFCNMLKRFAYYLSTVGLSFEEACLMVRFNPEDMTDKIRDYPIIQELVDIKELEYKVKLIKSVSRDAISGNEKLAQWLLERRFPGEFNPKKGTGSSRDEEQDLLGAAITFIQETNDSNPLIKKTSGRAFLIKKNSKEDIVTAVSEVHKILK